MITVRCPSRSLRSPASAMNWGMPGDFWSWAKTEWHCWIVTVPEQVPTIRRSGNWRLFRLRERILFVGLLLSIRGVFPLFELIFDEMYFVPFGTLFRRDFFIHIFDVGINFVYGCFVAIWFRCFYHNKKAPNGAVFIMVLRSWRIVELCQRCDSWY